MMEYHAATRLHQQVFVARAAYVPRAMSSAVYAVATACVLPSTARARVIKIRAMLFV